MSAQPRLLPSRARWVLVTVATLVTAVCLHPGEAAAQTVGDYARIMVKAPPRELTYREARRALLERVRSNPDEEVANVPTLLALLRKVPHAADKLLWTDVVEAVPGEEGLVALLSAIAKDRLKGGADDDALVAVLMSRLGSSQNPAYLGPLVAYLDARARKLGSPFCSAYDSLLGSFPQAAAAVEFLWSHELPGLEDPRRRATFAVLNAYQGPGAGELLTRHLRCQRPACRGLAIAIANKRQDAPTRQALMDSLVELASADPASFEAWIAPLKRLTKLASGGEEAALYALIDVAAAGGPHQRGALDGLLEVLGDTRRRAVPLARLEALVELGSQREPVFEAFDVLEHLDVAPVAPRLSKLIDDELRGRAAAYAAVEGGGDKAIASLVSGIADRPVTGQLALLDALYLPYQAQPWGKALVPLLSSDSPEVARAATALLIRSTDPFVRSRLEGVGRSQLQRMASPYHAVRDGLRVQWTLEGAPVAQGGSLMARVVVSNGGVLPFDVPPAIPSRYDRWQLMSDDTALGPLELFPAEEDEASPPAEAGEDGEDGADGAEAIEPISTLWDGGEITYRVDVGRALSALGPGRHMVRLAFFSRALHEADRARPDFVRESLPKAIEVEEPANIRAWLTSPAGVQTWAESPDDAYRKTAWVRFEANYTPPDPQAAGGGEVDAVLARLATRGKLSRGDEFSVRIESQAQPTEELRIDAKGRFVYTRQIDGPGGDAAMKLKTADVKAFFAALRAGRPFDHEPLQVLGLAREPLASVRLVVGRMNLIAPPLWRSELLRHPKTRGWMAMLERWRDEALAAQR